MQNAVVVMDVCRISHYVFVCPFCQSLAALPDQDSFYDMTDCLEQQGMEQIMQKHMSSKATEPDLKQQFTIYEVNTLILILYSVASTCS